jgi:hypothetical protein
MPLGLAGVGGGAQRVEIRDGYSERGSSEPRAEAKRSDSRNVLKYLGVGWFLES